MDYEITHLLKENDYLQMQGVLILSSLVIFILLSNWLIVAQQLHYLFTELVNHTNGRQFKRLSAAELSDFGCFIVLAVGVTLLQLAGLVRKFHPYDE